MLPSPVYKGVDEGRAGPLWRAPRGVFLLLVGVGFPPSLVGVGEEGRERGKEGKGLKGGRTPPLGLVRIGLGKGGAPFLPSLFPPLSL